MHTKKLVLLFLASSISFNLFGAAAEPNKEENTSYQNERLIIQFIRAVEKGVEDTEAVTRATEIVTCFLKQDKTLLDRVYDGSTPLAWAALNGSHPMVEFLCTEGIPVNTRMRSHSTALHAAAAIGCTKSIAALLKHKADVAAENIHAQTPLYRAIKSKKTEAALMLIEAGSPLNVTDDFGDSPLSLATRNDLPEVTNCIRQKLRSSQN